MRITIDQLDKLSLLKDRFPETDVVVICDGIALSKDWIHFMLENGDEEIELEGAISPTGEAHT
jgi:hypothetical protein